MSKKKAKVELDDGDLMDVIDLIDWGMMHLVAFADDNPNWKAARLVHAKRILGIFQYALGKNSGSYYAPSDLVDWKNAEEKIKRVKEKTK